MARLRQRAKALQVQQSQAARRLETRRAIIVGQWMMRHSPEAVARVVSRLQRPQDVAAFEGWQPPAAAHTVGLEKASGGQQTRQAA